MFESKELDAEISNLQNEILNIQSKIRSLQVLRREKRTGFKNGEKVHFNGSNCVICFDDCLGVRKFKEDGTQFKYVTHLDIYELSNFLAGRDTSKIKIERGWKYDGDDKTRYRPVGRDEARTAFLQANPWMNENVKA